MASVLFIVFGALFITMIIGAALSQLFRREIAIYGRLVDYFGSDDGIDRLEKDHGRKAFNWGILESTNRGLKMWIDHRTKPAKKKALEERLREAGYPMGLTPTDFRLLQFLVGATVFLCHILVFMQFINVISLLIFSTLMSILYMYCMSFYISTLIKKRRLAIQKMMPDFFDMVNLSIEAGMGLDASIVKICRQMKGPLSDEFLQTMRDMELGKSRREAFADLRSRVPVHQFQSVITSLIQADILGVGMAKALRSLTQRIREQRTQMAREQAMKAPVKMVFPMLLFIFPAMFIVMLGPLVIYLLQMVF
ncbi:type II secretion system F family protein [Sporosarcina sp. Marseille-Q4943]|uniref:type II secretion system F family protein n=1 Tax=Sporosarcina sp. Marseille-Q4943 TaxID=2942204 RepID=UPI00208DA653|nr:type II secretion system F family protein [Sporosarcina sp. Marseille-Q4943]